MLWSCIALATACSSSSEVPPFDTSGGGRAEAGPTTGTDAPQGIAEAPRASLGSKDSWDGTERTLASFADNSGTFGVDTPYGRVEVNVSVPGNTAPDSTASLWPLATNRNWKMAGATKVDGAEVPFKLQVKVAAPVTYEGQVTTPVDFVKNDPHGYWEPERDENLRWHIVDFGQSSEGFVWGRGDQRFDRTRLPNIVESRRFRYDTVPGSEINPATGRANPPYALYARNLKANPTNNGLGNALLTRHHYGVCSTNGGAGCTPIYGPGAVSWFAGVTNAKIRGPFSGGEWVDAKRIKFMEISIGAADGLTQPYTNDRATACRAAGDRNDPRRLYHAGVREDWYFVPGTGLALILQERVGLAPRYACVYDVARTQTTFAEAGSYAYLVRRDDAGYDPSFTY